MGYLDRFRRRFGLSTSVPSNESTHLSIFLRLDRAAKSGQVRLIVDQLLKSRERIGVVLLCGSSDDSVIRFVDRMRLLDLHDWLNPSDDQPEVAISPPRKRPLKPFMVDAFGGAGLLTGWALEEFGDRFADDAAVLQRLRQEPKFFVVTIAEERQATACVALQQQLLSLRALVTSETHDPGQCAGLLLVVWVPKGERAIDRLLALKAGLAPMSAREIAKFTPIQPPQFEAWWADVKSAKRLFRDDIDLEALQEQITVELFGHPSVQRDEVPMQRALAVLTRELGKHAR